VKGSEILELLPCKAGEEREDAILSAVKQGQYVDICWWPVKTEYQGHKGTIFVSMDALRLGEADDYFRPDVTAATAQRIADELDCIFPTTKIVDAAQLQAVARATPCLQPADPAERRAQGYPTCADGTTTMTDTPAMEVHSTRVSEKRGESVGLLSNIGKHWVITNRLLSKPATTAANYGWFDEDAPYRSASGLKLWQPLSTAHNDEHTDYSQVQPRLVRRLMLVDGEERSIFEVGNDPELCGLVSDEGVVKVWRQRSVPLPGQPEPPPVDPLPPESPDLDFDRLLRLQSPYMTGEDVRQWQRFLRISPDSIFGPQTDSATRAFQASHKDPATDEPLVVDGVVGDATTRAANEVLSERSDNHDGGEETLIDDFVEAKNYTKIDRSGDVKHVVIHTAEIAETLTAAEALAAWAAGPHAPRASWHYAVDADTIVQSVHDEYIAWHAPGANRTGIGIELAGRAKQTPEEWEDEFSQETLARAARMVAHLCEKWGLPIRFVDREGLKRGDAGITTHNEVTHAFGKSDHTDPGKHFPMDAFLEDVRSH
jgi:N-acetyl-anhydromuramyl-L-alanine amidase AmpD